DTRGCLTGSPLDIDSGVVISGELMVTHDTTKLSLAFPVAAVGMPAGATALAGVGRIDQRYWHPHPLRLVAEKRPQLPKGPIVVPCSLCCAPNPRPLANMRQIFQRNRPLRAFGFRNEP